MRACGARARERAERGEAAERETASPLFAHGPVGEQEPAFTKKAPGTSLCSGLLVKVAATYSPTGVQYHRRKRA